MTITITRATVLDWRPANQPPDSDRPVLVRYTAGYAMAQHEPGRDGGMWFGMVGDARTYRYDELLAYIPAELVIEWADLP